LVTRLAEITKSKWRVFVVLVVIFNVLVGVAFVSSNIYMWDYLNTQINEVGGNKGQGSFVIPYIEVSGLQVTVGHEFWSDNGTVVNLGPFPTGVPNYPFILFWVSMVGNLVFIAFAVVLHKTGLSTLLKKMENRISKGNKG
jgi:hypothetical protein